MGETLFTYLTFMINYSTIERFVELCNYFGGILIITFYNISINFAKDFNQVAINSLSMVGNTTAQLRLESYKH